MTSTPSPTAACTAAATSACDTPGSAVTAIASAWPGVASSSVAAASVNSTAVAPGRRVGRAEGGDAGDRELPRLALGEHGRDVARLVAGVVGARLVDDDLVVGGGRVAAGELVRVEVGDRHPVGAERRVLGDVADGLAVGPDELGVAVDAQRRLVDAVDRSDGVEQRGVEPGAGLAVAEVDRRRRPDVGVDAFVGLGQHGVEGGTDRVGEDEGAGHEGDTEEHREGGGQEAQLAGCELLDA